jgi:hypothetical protein
VTKGVDDWFSLFSNWVNATFSTAKLSFKNGCVPATQSEYVSMCLDQFVDEDVDVIFVEYAANDGYTDGSVNNGAVAAFERLLRKLLLHKRAPAVILFEFLATDAKQKQLPFYATGKAGAHTVSNSLMGSNTGCSNSTIAQPVTKAHAC